MSPMQLNNLKILRASLATCKDAAIASADVGRQREILIGNNSRLVLQVEEVD